MKDYFYFLGLDETASEEEIKKVYRKLSLKYHPDKNENDTFFETRFRELQEAYENLIDPKKRNAYLQSKSVNQKNVNNRLPPYIKTFEANKVYVQRNEDIVLKWITQNADVVKIFPFGLMPSYGEKKFKITGFKDGKFQVILHAYNSQLRKTVVKGITIFEGDEPLKKESCLKEKKVKETHSLNDDILNNNRFSLVFFILLLIFGLLCLIFYQIFK